MSALSWREIRERTQRFADAWTGGGHERAEAQSFYNDFFAIFGVPRRRIASFEEPVRTLGERRGYIDLLWKGVLLVEHKSPGGDLGRAKQQALDYFPGLRDTELPRYVLVSDFLNFELWDLESETGAPPVRFPLARLADHVQDFAFILGRPSRSFEDHEPVNAQAAALMGQLHDLLRASGYSRHDLERLLVRLVFCLFADATGIFEPRGIFAELIRTRTSEHGGDTGAWLIRLFEVLNTPDPGRQRALDADLAQFAYVDGALFAERLAAPEFDFAMRALLLQAMEFRWDAISPVIFGALFQSVMEPPERRAQGAHYTSGDNILKLIEPLFLDDLRAEFAHIRKQRAGRVAALKAFHDRLSRLHLFDPACGCGNFLAVAYRELRRLELQLLDELRHDGQLAADITHVSRLDVDQFYGIELNEFAARIAEVAMWMTDHLMNAELSRRFGEAYARIPLKKSPHIRNADALEADWSDVLPASECSYVLGNPPFGGAKYQSELQRAQVRRNAALGGAGGTLDFVTAWFIKAANYAGTFGVHIGFVATNSITQGEQVAQLWPLLLDRLGMEITFAHRTFVWESEVARGKAHVHVVIIGLAARDHAPAEKRLFSHDGPQGQTAETRHPVLTPYLTGGESLADPHLVIREAPRPINGAPPLVIGCQPIDGGNYIFTAEQKQEFLREQPDARDLMRPFVGAEELINGGDRWILLASEAGPERLHEMPAVRKRVAAVKEFRKRSSRTGTLKLAASPLAFQVKTIPRRAFLAIPEVSSEKRAYIPIGWLRPPVVPSNLLRVLLSDGRYNFAVLTSAMHMAWLRAIGGRLKSDFRYSIGIVYNTFPWPEATAVQREKLSELARAVLDARAEYPNATLGALYDRLTMPEALQRAHRALDLAVDRLYRRQPFASERERVEFLLARYERLATPLALRASPRRRAAVRRGRAQ